MSSSRTRVVCIKAIWFPATYTGCNGIGSGLGSNVERGFDGMGILCVFCVYDTIGNRCFEKTSFPKNVPRIHWLKTNDTFRLLLTLDFTQPYSWQNYTALLLILCITVSHFSYAPLFQGSHFWQQCWNRTFSRIISFFLHFICLMTWTHIGITHSNQFATSRAILTKMHVQPERLYFLFAFCARHYPWWSIWQKNTQNNYFIQVNLLFLAVEFSNTVTFLKKCSFWGHINIKYNNQNRVSFVNCFVLSHLLT